MTCRPVGVGTGTPRLAHAAAGQPAPEAIPHRRPRTYSGVSRHAAILAAPEPMKMRKVVRRRTFKLYFLSRALSDNRVYIDSFNNQYIEYYMSTTKGI
jgi:hypothetical protein